MSIPDSLLCVLVCALSDDESVSGTATTAFGSDSFHCAVSPLSICFRKPVGLPDLAADDLAVSGLGHTTREQFGRL